MVCIQSDKTVEAENMSKLSRLVI